MVRRSVVDFAACPIYIIHRGDVERSLPDWPAWAATDPGRATLAWTAPILDVVLRDWLRSRGRWRGRGPAMVVDVPAVTAEVRSAGPVHRRKLARSLLLATVIHELSHALSHPGRWWRVVQEPPRIFHHPPPSKIVASQAQDDASHELSFVRAAAHLIHRVNRHLPTGEIQVHFADVTMDAFVNPFEFTRAFATECHALADQPIVSLLSLPLPRAACAAWLRRHATDPPHQERPMHIKTPTSISSILIEEQQKSSGSILKLAYSIAAGEATPDSTTAKVITDQGMSGAAFDELVETLRHRINLRAELAESERLADQVARIDARIAEHDKALRAAEKAYETATATLDSERRTLIRRMTAAPQSVRANAIRHELAQTCPDPEFRDPFAKAEASVRELREGIDRRDEAIRESRRRHQYRVTHGEDAEISGERHEREVRALEAEIEKLRGELVVAETEVHRLAGEAIRA